MYLKNTTNNLSISYNELDYFIELKLQTPNVDEDWIAENLPFEDLEELIILKLNDKERKEPLIKKSMFKRKLKKNRVIGCTFEEFDDMRVYRIPKNNLSLDISFTSTLKVRPTFKKMLKYEDICATIHIRFIINSNKIIDRLIDITIIQ